MWALKFIHGDRKIYLLTGKTYTIGRRDADIVILNDNSISRKHATIEIKPSTENNCGYQVILSDFSKFGLFCGKSNKNGEKEKVSFVKVAKQQEIHTGDVIRVGLQNSLLRLVNEPLQVVTSMMDSQSLKQLKTLVGSMGGRVVTDWGPGVTHLATQEIILNIKVSQALACSCPIVTPQYFDELKKVYSKEGISIPQTDRFLPEVAELGVNKNECSFLPDPQRKSLFMGKTFVFLSKKQIKRLGVSCELASGTSILINDEAFNMKMVRDKETCVVFCANAAESQIISNKKYENLQEVLIKNNLRFVQEHEIGLALLYVSTDVYCNPSFDLNQSSNQQHLVESAVSQVLPEYGDERKKVLDLEPIEHSLDPGSSKRKRSEEDIVETTSSKSIKTVESSSAATDNNVDFFSGLTSFRKPKRKPPPKPAPKQKRPPPVVSIDANELPLTKQEGGRDIQAQSHDLINTETYDDTENDFKFQPIMESTEKIPEDEMNFENFPDSCISDDSLWCDSEQVGTKPTSRAKKIRLTTIEDSSEKYPSPVKRLNSQSQVYDDSVSVVEDQPENEDKQKSASTNVKIKQEQIEECSSVGGWLNSVNSQVAPSKVKREENAENFDLVKVVEINLVVGRRNKYFNNGAVPIKQGKNFKNFHKVLPTYMAGYSPQLREQSSVRIPRIIGGTDLFRHDNRLEEDLKWDVVEGGTTLNSNTNSFELECSQDSNPFRNVNKGSSKAYRR